MTTPGSFAEAGGNGGKDYEGVSDSLLVVDAIDGWLTARTRAGLLPHSPDYARGATEALLQLISGEHTDMDGLDEVYRRIGAAAAQGGANG